MIYGKRSVIKGPDRIDVYFKTRKKALK